MDEPKVGQIWASNDRRDIGAYRCQRLRIEEIIGERVRALNLDSGRSTTISVRRLRPDSTGYRLVRHRTSLSSLRASREREAYDAGRLAGFEEGLAAQADARCDFGCDACHDFVAERDEEDRLDEAKAQPGPLTR